MKVFPLLLMSNFILISAQAQLPEGKKIERSLYLYDMHTRKSTLLIRENRHFKAPNWAPNRIYLLLNSNGKIEKYSLKGEALGTIYTGELSKNNNDHGISFDGNILFFSSGQNKIKTHSSSYWRGVSPDGETIVYCAERNGNYDVYKMSANGGEEIRPTTAEGLDDGPEYSPDGRYIYFNSFQTGKMQIWRMFTDDTHKEQMTFDNYSNWFAHIAPHNQNAVPISYTEDQDQQHPFGKQLKLSLLDLATKELSDLTPIFYDEPGTLNIPSWNLQWTQFLYVTYALKDQS